MERRNGNISGKKNHPATKKQLRKFIHRKRRKTNILKKICVQRVTQDSGRKAWVDVGINSMSVSLTSRLHGSTIWQLSIPLALILENTRQDLTLLIQILLQENLKTNYFKYSLFMLLFLNQFIYLVIYWLLCFIEQVTESVYISSCYATYQPISKVCYITN